MSEERKYFEKLLTEFELTFFLQAIREALDVIDADPTINLADFNTDYDSGDRFIDSITIFHSGYGAEWGVSSLLPLLYHAFVTNFCL